MQAAYSKVYSADDKIGYLAKIVISTTVKKYSATNNNTYIQSADKITWSVTNDGVLNYWRLLSSNTSYTINNDELRAAPKTQEADVSNISAGGSITCKHILWGNIAKAGKVKVHAEFAGGKDMYISSGTYSADVEIEFVSGAKAAGDTTAYDKGTTITNDVSNSSIATDSDTHDPRDPTSREWNGLNPPFSFNTSEDAASGVKPKVTWAKPSDFKAGTSTDTIVATITGPATEINVYIAGKDAAKLFGWTLEKGETPSDVSLTKSSIRYNNIPFRVIAVDSTDNIATGDKKKDKNAKTTVTIAFNGGNFAYKGFPLTVSAVNNNNPDKPATKTVKLNIKPYDTTPEWGTAEFYSTTITVGGKATKSTKLVGKIHYASSYTEWMSDAWRNQYDHDHASYITKTFGRGSYSYKYVRLPVKVKYFFVDGVRNRYEYNSTNIADNIYPAYSTNSSSLGTDDYGAWSYTGGTKMGYLTEQRGEYWYAKIPTSFHVIYSEYEETTTITGGTDKTITTVDFTAFDKKDKPELVAAVYPNNEEGGQGGSIREGTYYVQAPAPFTIAQPKDPKDAGISISITQPKFDYLGNNTTSGCVRIYGTLKTTTKESKNAVALTAANPSTKKKGTLKVTVLGKTVPEFQKTNTFTFDTSILGDTDTDTAFINSYGYAKDREKITTKKVAAPKVPKAQFKAKGSKTITYKLGLYDSSGNADWKSAYSHTRSKFTEDAELWDFMYGYLVTHGLVSGYGKQFNDELEANLAALNLSFDLKKGAVVILTKGGKTVPTVNDDGDQFESLDIAVTAVNDVGSAQAWAELAITGEKPKVADKTVSISGSVPKGKVFKFKVLSNKTAAETVTDNSVNIRCYTADDNSAKVLSDWGLELVNYDSMDILVSDEVTFAIGEEVPAYGNVSTQIVQGAVVASDDTWKAANKNGESYAYIVLKSGDTWVRSQDTTCKNYGLIQVTDQAKLAKVVADAAAKDDKEKTMKKLNKGSKVSLILDNLGAIGKGKITVTLAKDITDGGDPAASSTNTASSVTSAASIANVASPVKTGHAAALDSLADLAKSEQEEESYETESVIIGTTRTAAEISAEQKAFLADNGYTVIAVLPEVSANIDGQYEFAVKLDENAPEGKKLIWLAFPQNAEESDDDKIADFYDADGKYIENVPAEKDISVEVWLRAEVLYQPVIAVKTAK